MTKNEYYTLKGYLSILENAPPNGRYIHTIRNKITAIRLHLHLKTSLPTPYEYEICKLIDRLYGEPRLIYTDAQNIDIE